MSSVYNCTPTQVKQMLKTCLSIGEPVFISGEPGTGKTSLVGEVAAEEGYDYNPIITAQTDALDTRGIPYKNQSNQTEYAMPKCLPTTGKPLIFLDELPNAPQLVLNAWQQIIIPPHRLGDYTLPTGGRVVAAGNRQQDRAGAGKLSTAMSSRFVHINWIPDALDWVAWGSKNGINPITLSFVKFRPELFHKFNKNAQTFPCARTWEKVSKFETTNLSDDLFLLAVAGSVGEEVAGEYHGYRKIYQVAVKSIDGIMLNPSTYPVPTEISELYAVTSALGHYMTPKNFGQIMNYLDRIDNREYTVTCVKVACERDTHILVSPEFHERFGMNPLYKELVF